MIDPKLLRTDPDLLRRAQEARGESVELVDELVSADSSRRAAIAAFENLRAEQKELGKQIPKASGEERATLLGRTRELAEQVKKAEAAEREAGLIEPAIAHTARRGQNARKAGQDVMQLVLHAHAAILRQAITQ